MAASPPKSPSSSTPAEVDPTKMFVPPEDLTCHNFESRPDLTDRQLFAWAYQTETRVRFDKLEGRTSPSATTHLQESKEALSSDYLLDVYPAVPLEKPMTAEFDSILERDQQAFQRKAANFLAEHKPQDGSLTPIQIDDPGVSVPSLSEDNFDGMLPVPPNFLYFEICLECFVGYDLRYIFNASDPTLPKPAIMGGAIVAALSAWSDEYVVSLFKEFDLEDCLTSYNAKVAKISDKYPARKRELTKMLQEEYTTRKNLLIKILHEYYLSTGDEDGQFSIYNAGDVDVFLQSPALPRDLYQCLLQKSGGNADLVCNIQSFIGGIGWCHDSLRAFARVVYDHLSTKYEDQGGFVFALAKNGLSSMYAPSWGGYNPQPPEEDEPVLPWPRNTQLIMMDPRADLQGAILDFDISTAACAFDGISVRITPRSALSLVRRVAVVTPFCFEEKRNRRRLMKYVRRGFYPAVVDPHCLHDTPCQNSYTARIAGPPTNSNEQPAVSKKCWEWHSPGNDIIEECRRIEDEAFASVHNIPRDFRARDGGAKDPAPLLCCCKDAIYPYVRLYNIDQFEEKDGHALEFFADLNSWDEVMRRKVARVPKQLRQACEPCRNFYAMFLLLQDGSSDDDATWNDIDLHKDKAIHAHGVRHNFFRPSFYSGGAFDSTLVRERARHFFQAEAAVAGQSIAEKLRYVVEHGTIQGYQPRFACFDVWRLRQRSIVDHGSSALENYRIFNQYASVPHLPIVFDEAMKNPLASPARPPIGLNPERFIAKCQGCSKWLHGCEFGTDFCSHCQDS